MKDRLYSAVWTRGLTSRPEGEKTRGVFVTGDDPLSGMMGNVVVVQAGLSTGLLSEAIRTYTLP